MKALRIVVHGYVQGVGFRSFARHHARALNIKGYVKNMPDGTVLIVAEGDEKNLNLFLERVSRGPFMARVDRVETEEIPPMGFGGFTIEF
ncbi:MAG: acylphosphatase [Thermotogae bacterium]|nr:acylphosphatase [Thermotogota bacterium]